MVLPDLILYLISLLLSLAGLAIVDNVVEKRDKLHVLAVIAFVIIFFMNIFVPVYHVTAKNKYRPTYSCYLVLSCYIFFGIQKLFVCFILGLSVTAFSIITLLLTTYTHDDFLWKRVSSLSQQNYYAKFRQNAFTFLRLPKISRHNFFMEFDEF